MPDVPMRQLFNNPVSCSEIPFLLLDSEQCCSHVACGGQRKGILRHGLAACTPGAYKGHYGHVVGGPATPQAVAENGCRLGRLAGRTPGQFQSTQGRRARGAEPDTQHKQSGGTLPIPHKTETRPATVTKKLNLDIWHGPGLVCRPPLP